MTNYLIPLLLSVVVLDAITVNGNNKTSSFDIRITLARIPKVNTYYVCQQFKVPDNETYHAVSFEPLIGNKDAVHHILVFGCDFQMNSYSPHPCTNIDNRCRTWLVKWDVGMQGEITMPEEAGVRFGKGSFKHLLLQIHWNNPNLLVNSTDNSGMRIYYTNRLRPYDVGNFQIGQNKIEIPPVSRDVVITGSCSSTCTSLMLPHPIYITSIYLHMHDLGWSTSLVVRKGRETIHKVVEDTQYDYQHPVVHNLPVPYEVSPGEEIRLSCVYNSKDGHRYRNHTVSWGQGSSAEMCYAFIRYYPHIMGFDQCIQLGYKDVNCRQRHH